MERLIINQSTVTDRENLGGFLNEQGLLGTAVEIGTHRGKFANQLLSQWNGQVLNCVDPWQPGYDEGDPASYGDRDQDYQQAQTVLAKYGNRCRLLRQTSADASKLFTPESIDFVYLDGCHRYESVYEDLRLWWPKVKPGGLLAGHDIICPHEDRGGWGRYIQPAVFGFAEENQLTVWLVFQTRGNPWSYYFVKRSG